ncbi:MAG: magnesium/cobalt transporter CorA [Planctomycetes bacterium]|nr:magnesium/cobalt transporter CorA [Planctomycetota bacterium]
MSEELNPRDRDSDNGGGSDESDRRPPVGAVPGTLVEDEDAFPTVIRLFDFGPDHSEEHVITDLGELEPYLNKGSVTWIDVSGFRDLAMLQSLAERLGLHRLVLADAVNVPQRSKTEAYPDYLLFITQQPYIDEEDEEVHNEQVSIVVAHDFVLSFQEIPTDDCFEPVRDRIRNRRGLIRSKGGGYLGYALVDVLTDEVFPLLDDLEDQLEALERKILDGELDVLTELYVLKHACMDVRRAIDMHRDAVNSLLRLEAGYIPEDVKPFLRDAHDHCVSQTGMAQTLQDFAVSLRELVSSTQANRLNDVMRVLTIVATIFIPLSFFAGVYGMNFDTSQPGNMPELAMPYGYWIFWGFMASLVASMLVWFRVRKWI